MLSHNTINATEESTPLLDIDALVESFRLLSVILRK